MKLTDVFVAVQPDLNPAEFERDLKRKLDRVDGRRAGASIGQNLGKGMKVSLFQSFGDVGKGITGAFAGLAALKVFGGFINDARESARVGRLTEQVIKTTGRSAGITADEVGKLATSISNKTGIDDEAIQSAQNLLLTFTNVRNEVGKGNDVFNQASQAAVDMAVALGTEPSKAAIQLGKALNDPIKGITALSKAGVSFTAQQKTQIKTLVESGRTLDAQKIILAELNKEFGGAAAAAADPLDKLKVIAGNLGETVGGLLLPVVERAATALADMAPYADQLAGFIGSIPGPAKAAALTIGGLVVATKLLAPVATIPGKLAEGFTRLVDAGGRAEVTGGKIATAGSRISSAFKGALLSISPLTIAIGAAATVVGIYAKKKADAKQVVDDFTESIKSDSGVLGENTRALVAHRLEQEGALKAAQVFKLNLSDVTDAALGNQDALTRINAVLAAYAASQQEAASAGDVNNATSKESDEAYRTLTDSISGTNSAITDATGAAQRQTAATGPATKAIKDQGVAAAGTATQVKVLKDDLFDLTNVNLDAAQSEIAFRDSLARLTASVKENGTSLSLNTQKGRDNRGAVLGSIEAAQRHAKAVGEQTKAVGNGSNKIEAERRAFEKSIPQIREQARRLGLNKVEVDKLIGSIAKLKPKTVPVKAVVSVVDAIAARMDARAPGDGSRGRAFGGPVPGVSPGDRSDNVPIRATAGEWVIQRPSVRKLERAQPGIMAAINAGQVDVGGDPDTMRLSIGKRITGQKPRGYAAGGQIAAVQSYLKAQAGEPYIWGGVGPYGGDCSGYVGNAYGLLTGRPANRRYFTTATIGAAQGFRPGRGTFTVGVTAGSGHMAGNLAGLKFEATPPRLRVGPAASSVTSFARQFYLPQVGGRFVGTGSGMGGPAPLTGRQKTQIVKLISPTISRQIVRELGGRQFDSGGEIPARSTGIWRNNTYRSETVTTGKTMDAVVGELQALRRAVETMPAARIDGRVLRREVGYGNTRSPGNTW